MKKIIRMLFSIVLVTGFVLFLSINQTKAEQGGSDPCCRNGYKTWSDPGFFGGGTNFKDCWCNDHKGKDMVACSCGPNSGGGGIQ